jgi:hypothetical protein
MRIHMHIAADSANQQTYRYQYDVKMVPKEEDKAETHGSADDPAACGFGTRLKSFFR